MLKKILSEGTGNALNAEQKLQSFLLNQLQTDQSIAKSAGRRKDLQDSPDNSTKNTAIAVFFLYKKIIVI
jgi:hypothetical protein